MIRCDFRSRSRSPDRQRNFGASLGRLATEPSPIDPNAETPKLFNTVRSDNSQMILEIQTFENFKA